MPRTREERFIYDQIKNEIPTIKEVGRQYIVREFEADKLIAFIYKIFLRGVERGRKNAKISYKGRIRKAIAKVLEN